MPTIDSSAPPKSSTLWARIRRRWGVLAIIALVLLVVFWYTVIGPRVLRYAIQNEDLPLARIALSLAVSPETITGNGYTVLAGASLCRPAFVRLLIAKGANPRAGGRFAPMRMIAGLDECSSAGEIVEMLVGAGASVENCVDGISALENVQIPQVAEALLKHGVDPNNLCLPKGHSPLFSAVERPEILKLLLDHGAKILPDARTLLTPLHTAAALVRITNLVRALNRGDATHFAVRNVTVGD